MQKCPNSSSVLIIAMIACAIVTGCGRSDPTATAAQRRHQCIQQLYAIEFAKDIYALEHGGSVTTILSTTQLLPCMQSNLSNMQVTAEEEYNQEFTAGPFDTWPVCPEAGTYTVGALTSTASCTVSNHFTCGGGGLCVLEEECHP